MKHSKPHTSPVSAAAAIAALFLIAEAPYVRELVRDGLLLCVNSVIPSLFPFAVMTELIFFDGRGIVPPKFLRRAVKSIFGVAESLSSAFVTGIIAGFPMGATAISKIYSANGCTKEEAEYAAAISGLPSPAFVIGAVGISVFSSIHAGLFLLAVQYMSVFPVSVILRLTGGKGNKSECAPVIASQGSRFCISALGDAIKNAGHSMLAVCSCVVFFTVISGCATHLLCVSEVENGCAAALLSGLFEMTAGTSKLGEALTLRALPYAAAILGFGGISVVCQISAVCGKNGISVTPCIISRVYFAFFNFIFTLTAEYFIPGAMPTLRCGIADAITPKYKCIGAIPYFEYAFLFAVSALVIRLAPSTLFAIFRRIHRHTQKKNAVPHTDGTDGKEN